MIYTMIFFPSAFKTDKKPPKRKKLKKLAEAEESQTNEEENPNGIPAPPPSKRQKKKQKQQQNIVRNKDKEIEKTISYLVKWDTNRDEWKYEKLRQIFIQKNIFDEKVIDSEHCDVAIKYLATSKVICHCFNSFDYSFESFRFRLNNISVVNFT